MTRTHVSWRVGAERRGRLEAELRRPLAELPRLGVKRAILFGSLASGNVGQTSDHYCVPTRYPNSLPGGIPAEAFDESDARRALTVAASVIQLVKAKVSEP